MKIFKKYRNTIMKYICILAALIGAEIAISDNRSALGNVGTILFIAGIICSITIKIKEYREKK